ncbi:nodulation protein NolB [Jannaschia sp. LMIT008]|uniref:nodulation protein NolB n=1 Tax=Jannaschia maritima TaxID=3032585 RepID=UPI0028115A96|nr:nodulation protein NolB [Jannaschia sp. LMIT008]
MIDSVGPIPPQPDLIPAQASPAGNDAGTTGWDAEIARAPSAEPSLSDRLAMRAETLGRNSLGYEAGRLSGIGGDVSVFERGAPEDVTAIEEEKPTPPSFSDMMSNFNSAYSHAVQVSVLSSGLTGMTKSLNKLMSGN